MLFRLMEIKFLDNFGLNEIQIKIRRELTELQDNLFFHPNTSIFMDAKELFFK